MPQLYARVFIQILDSSLAEDYQTRHVFEDLLKLTNQDGVVDMTRQSIARRTNVPLDIINTAIDKLESPDPGSRDREHEGCRIVRLDEHRDWGWRILNFQKYEEVRVNNDMREWNAARMANYRSKKKAPPVLLKESTSSSSPSPERIPTCRIPVVLQAQTTQPPNDEKNTNHPSLDAVQEYVEKVINPNLEVAYTKQDINLAFKSLEAGSFNGLWRWGSHMVGDWRSAIETRLGQDRSKNQSKTIFVQPKRRQARDVI